MPRITARRVVDALRELQRFNEAGRNAPDNWRSLLLGLGVDFASMRPGRNAPDNPSGRGGPTGRCPRFNEAGAKCPG